MPFVFKTKRIAIELSDGQLGWLLGVISLGSFVLLIFLTS